MDKFDFTFLIPLGDGLIKEQIWTLAGQTAEGFRKRLLSFLEEEHERLFKE